METSQVSLFIFTLLNLIKNNILDFLFAVLACMLGGMLRKQLIVSFVKHFTENQKNRFSVL